MLFRSREQEEQKGDHKSTPKKNSARPKIAHPSPKVKGAEEAKTPPRPHQSPTQAQRPESPPRIATGQSDEKTQDHRDSGRHEGNEAERGRTERAQEEQAPQIYTPPHRVDE